MAGLDKKDDDIRVGDVRLDDRPADAVTGEATIEIAVVDKADRPTPCRLTIVDANGTLVPLGAKSDGHLAVRTGVVYTADGAAKFGIAAGNYTVYATRGMEYSAEAVAVTARAGSSGATGCGSAARSPRPAGSPPTRTSTRSPSPSTATARSPSGC